MFEMAEPEFMRPNRKNRPLLAGLCALALLTCTGARCDTPEGAVSAPPDAADKRYEEMLTRMQDAVEEIAQLYGNPTFLEVFTNDPERASDLKNRLRAERTSEQVRQEASDLQRKRDDLLGDIALRKRESTRLAEKLARQRAALDSLAHAVEQAQKAVEETAR